MSIQQLKQHILLKSKLPLTFSLKTYGFTTIKYSQNFLSLYVTYVKPQVLESKSPAIFCQTARKKIYLPAFFYLIPLLSFTSYFSHVSSKSIIIHLSPFTHWKPGRKRWTLHGTKETKMDEGNKNRGRKKHHPYNTKTKGALHTVKHSPVLFVGN